LSKGLPSVAANLLSLPAAPESGRAPAAYSKDAGRRKALSLAQVQPSLPELLTHEPADSNCADGLIQTADELSGQIAMQKTRQPASHSSKLSSQRSAQL
jgi:hypothetical protein